MTRAAASIAITFFLTSCSSLSRDLSRLEPSGSAVDAVFDATFENVWLAVSDVLRQENLAVETLDEELGMIWTEFVAAVGNTDEQACLGLHTGDNESVEAIRYRLRFEVTGEGGARTRVRAYADVQGKVLTGDGSDARNSEGAWSDCTSTGEIERRLLDTIQARLEEG